jgi:hypothetical protein
MNVPKVLQVKPPDNEKDHNEGLHPYLPQQPNLITIYGAWRSGKSNLLVNLIQNPDFLRGRMDRIVLFSPTALNDNSMRFLVEDDNIDVISEYSDDYLKALLEFQLEQPKEYRDKLMLIADDALDYIKRTGKNSGLTYLATKFRHYNIGYYIIVSQYYKALPPMIRSNAGSIIFMKIPNTKTLKDASEELDGFLNGNFMKLYVYCIYNEPYSFMYINMRENPPTVFLRFEKPIYAGRWLVEEPPDVDVDNLLRSETEFKSTQEEKKV